MSKENEIFDLVDLEDRVIGTARRSEVHGNPELIHRVAHVLVVNIQGDLYLQKRGTDKDVQPGKWDTSVGGHVDAGETYREAAIRELSEELGIIGPEPFFLHRYLHRNDFESEYVSTFLVRWDGAVILQESEIDDGRFWTMAELAVAEADGSADDLFTPNFLDELARWRDAGYPGRPSLVIP